MILKRYIRSSIKNVEEVNISEVELRDVRAILLPTSPSATHSSSLIKNGPEAFLNSTKTESLPSPINSSEDEETKKEEAQSVNSSRTGISHQRGRRMIREKKRPIILLKQSLKVERFTFGASTDNHMVLRHDEADDDGCYINLSHCHLYPDPDDATLVLHNLSTSTFSAQPLRLGGNSIDVEPSTNVVLECGSWRLRLGKGFQFQIKVLTRPQEEHDYNWTLISDCSPSLRPPWKNNKSRRALDENDRREGKEEPRTSQHSSKVSQEPSVLHETVIGETSLTKVFRVRRRGTIVAAKVCRKPDLKWAASMWKREASILRKLSHVSYYNPNIYLIALMY